MARALVLAAVLVFAGCGSRTTADRDRAAADQLLKALAANDDATANALFPYGRPRVGTRVKLSHVDSENVAALGRQVDCGRDANSPVTGPCYRYCLPGSLSLDGDPYDALEVNVSDGRVTAYASGRC